MGLDVVLLTEATMLAPAAPDASGVYHRPPGVPEEAALIHNDLGYEDRQDDHPTGWYAGEPERIKGFSYGGYNEFREILSLAVLGVTPKEVWEAARRARENPTPALSPYVGRPFADLIDFSDCDGCFGPDTSRRLAEDFRAHRTKVLAAMNGADYGYGADGYERIGDAFRRAGEAEALAFVVWR